MRLLDKLTEDAQQHYILMGEAGELIDFRLRFMPRVTRWEFDIAYRELNLKGAGLTVSPNVIRAYRNLIQFGLMVTSEDQLDPFYQNDFTTGRIKIYLLNNAEKLEIEQLVYS